MFSPETLTFETFKKFFAQVCTRVMGYTLPHTALVPMADNLNHADQIKEKLIMTKSLHQKGFKRD